MCCNKGGTLTCATQVKMTFYLKVGPIKKDLVAGLLIFLKQAI